MAALIALFMVPIFAPGQIVFSDLAFGVSSRGYLSQIFGIWNNHWNTPNLFNLPRLIYILPFYLVSIPFGFSGEVLLKSLIYGVALISAFSFYVLASAVLRAFYKSRNALVTTQLILIAGSLLYALNPWAIMRIQHIFLLCGYSLLPLLIYYFLRIFHPHFRASQETDPGTPRPRNHFRPIVLDIVVFAFLYSTAAASIHFAIYSVFVLIAIGVVIVVSGLLRLQEPSTAGASPRFPRVTIILMTLTLLLFPGSIVLSFIVAVVLLIRLNKAQRGYLATIALKALGVLLATSITSFYWLAPYVLSVIRDVLPSQLNVNTIETVRLFSQHSSLINVLYGNSYWWPMFDYTSLPILYFIGGGAILVVAMFALRLRPRGYSLRLAAFSLPLVLLSTGTTYPILNQIYVQVVLGGIIPFGNMFRDPDKLVGLWMLALSLLFVLGAYYLITTLQSVKQRAVTYLTYLFCLVLVVSLVSYLMPFRRIYLEGFYKPVQVPSEYREAEGFLAANLSQDARILYLPISDGMVNPAYGYATPSWNLATVPGIVPKATNDFQVFNSKYKTMFHQEGNPPFVEYYFNYLQHALDHGASSHVGGLLSLSGAEYLVYYSDYLAQKTRQALNLNVLAMQPGLRKVFQNSRVTIYKVETPLPKVFVLPHKVFTPYGIDRLERYAAYKDFDFSRHGVIFTSSGTYPTWQSFSAGDYVEAHRFEDLLLSMLPAQDYIAPFDTMQGGSAWLKTYAQNQDWRWQLGQHHIKNAAFDLDFGRGIVFTAAPARIQIPERSTRPTGPALIAYQPGKDAMPILTSTTPDLLNITVGPIDMEPALQGRLAPAATATTWYTARSGPIDIAEGAPYRFDATLSGINTQDIHFKIHYFDEEYHEIGVEYILGAQARVNFTKERFESHFVTPARARRMQIALLLRPDRPGAEAAWWLHELRLEDLSAYRQPNAFEMALPRQKDVQGALHARLFFSPAGGTVAFQIGGVSTPINTRTNGPAGFRWVKIAAMTVQSSNTPIQVENLAGFNALNVLAFVPDAALTQLANTLRERVQHARVFMTLEAESDFTYVGDSQSASTYPILSSGEGIRSQDGLLESSFEVIKAGAYTIHLRHTLPSNPAGAITVRLLKPSGAVIFETRLPSAGVANNSKGMVDVIIPDAVTGSPVATRVASPVATMQDTPLDPIDLAPGHYDLQIQFDSQARPLATLASFASLSQPTAMTVAPNARALQAVYTPAENDNWRVLSTDFIRLNAQSSIFTSMTLRSQNVRDRHIKVKFFDENKNELQVTYFDEIDALLHRDWHTYMRYLLPPSNARYLQVQVLARASKSATGLVEMADMKLWQAEELAMVDTVWLYEVGANELWQASRDPEELTPLNLGLLGRQLRFPADATGDQFVVLPETYSPLWQNASDSRAVLPFNGLLTMIQVGERHSPLVFLDLNLIYYVGLGGYVGFALVVGLYAFSGHRPRRPGVSPVSFYATPSSNELP